MGGSGSSDSGGRGSDSRGRECGTHSSRSGYCCDTRGAAQACRDGAARGAQWVGGLGAAYGGIAHGPVGLALGGLALAGVGGAVGCISAYDSHVAGCPIKDGCGQSGFGKSGGNADHDLSNHTHGCRCSWLADRGEAIRRGVIPKNCWRKHVNGKCWSGQDAPHNPCQAATNLLPLTPEEVLQFRSLNGVDEKTVAAIFERERMSGAL